SPRDVQASTGKPNVESKSLFEQVHDAHVRLHLPARPNAPPEVWLSVTETARASKVGGVIPNCRALRGRSPVIHAWIQATTGSAARRAAPAETTAPAASVDEPPRRFIFFAG